MKISYLVIITVPSTAETKGANKTLLSKDTGTALMLKWQFFINTNQNSFRFFDGDSRGPETSRIKGKQAFSYDDNMRPDLQERRFKVKCFLIRAASREFWGIVGEYCGKSENTALFMGQCFGQKGI